MTIRLLVWFDRASPLMGDSLLRAAFRVKSSFLAEVAMDLRKIEIITDLVAQAEHLGLTENESAIFDIRDLGLKAVVLFSQRLIHVLTMEEAAKAGLPTCDQCRRELPHDR